LEARPDQPRKAIDPEGLEELTRSIREYGVLQPIRVRRLGDRYQIVAGERRWIAAQRAGLKEIPALIANLDDDRSFIEALIENTQREDLNAVDRARALKRLRATLGLHSWEEVGLRIGISRVHVHRLLNITRLPGPIQEDIRVCDLTEKHARALLRLRRFPDLQMRLWKRVHSESLSGDAALDAADALLPAPATEQIAGAGVGRVDLLALVEQLLTGLMTAPPMEIQSARAELNDLSRWLGEVLGGPL
jgi:ParB family chromosome partitioning protein